MITEFILNASVYIMFVLGLYWWIAVLFIGHISPFLFVILSPCALLIVCMVIEGFMDIFQWIWNKI